MINGRPFRGARGIAGEIGHVLVDRPGPDLPLRQPRLPRDLRRRPRPVRAAAPLARRPSTVHQLLALAQEGDAGCQRVVADAGRVRRRAPSPTSCNYLNPDLVVVGGDLSAAGRPGARADARGRRRFAIPAAAEDVEIVAGDARRPRRAAGRSLALAGHESEDPLTVPVPHMSHPRQEEEDGDALNASLVGRSPVEQDALCALTFAVAACGSDDNNSTSSSGGGGSTTAAARPRRSACCCRTPSRRSAGRRSTGRCSRRPSRPRACRSTIQNAQGDKSTQQQQAEQTDHERREGAPAREPRLRARARRSRRTPSRAGREGRSTTTA